MDRKRPRFGHRAVLHLEPSRKATTFVGVFLSLVAAAVLTASLVYRAGDWPESWPPSRPLSPHAITVAVWVGTIMLLVGLVTTLVNGRRWRVNRAIVRLSDSSQLSELMPDTAWTTQASRAQRIPALSVADINPRKLPKPRGLGPVRSQSNAAGDPPLHMAYLRLFENQPRARTFFQGAWREFGYVYLLRSASSVSPREFRQLERVEPAEMFVGSPYDLKRELARSAGPPVSRGFHSFRNISAVAIRTWDRYGGYPPVPVLCHGSYWKQAVDELLLRVDAVVLDLSGFRPENEGTGYEVQRVVDRFPIERVLFLADRRSDRDFLRRTIQDAWAHMASRSPNAGRQPRRTYLAVTDSFQTWIRRDAQGHEIDRQTRLVASRSETRKLAAWLQSSVASAPAVRR